MSLTREQITAMLDGLDGLALSPWRAETDPDEIGEDADVLSSDYRVVATTNISHASHIARCDPDTIRALCELALRGMTLRAENERLQRERDDAFAKLASHEAMDPRYISSLLEARAKAIEEAAQIAQVWGYRPDIAERILALREKP